MAEPERTPGKVAVITGASGGIGAAIALELAKAGANVAIGARRLEALESVKTDIEEIGASGRVIAVQTDVTSREEMQNLVDKAEETLGPVDILVNNGECNLVDRYSICRDTGVLKDVAINAVAASV
ncbi:Oxidoreductase [Phytophthora palmivora]|uniref:Oxidoreductase n=1 Tax=Phytophthora palmivora TaxID=4796 RepID=A0A2P4XMC9_9STRA|nr:Oxidoreductase [Phytophthora palmivora]